MDTGDIFQVTRVNLNVDDDNYYTAGNDTGQTIEVTCPWGTQAMADSILASIQGYQYKPYTAIDALLDPAAEIGDAVTVGGIYSVIANVDTVFDRACAPSISAPESDEIDDEYPYESRERKDINRQLAQTRAAITKTADEIMLTVEGLDNEISLIDQKVDSITLSVSNGESSSQIRLMVNGISVSSQTIRFTGDVVFESDLSSGYTLISGDCIRTGQISANYIHLGGQMDVYQTASGNVFGGYIGYMSGMTASGSSTAGIAIASSNEAAVVICTTNGARMGYDGVSTVVCTSNQVSIRGDSVFINGMEQTSSDGRIKTEKQYDVDDYLNVFDKLKPCTFVYEGHTRRHMGLIAQEVQETVAKEGIDEKNFAAICTIPESEDFPDGLYTLRYGEIQIMTIAKVQQLNRRLSELEAKING